MRRSSLIVEACEPLEFRRLLHASLSPWPQYIGLLHVTGTEGNDTIVVYRTGSSIAVRENGGAPQLFPAAQTRQVIVSGGPGNDHLTLATGLNLYYMSLNGQDGNDTLIGSDGPDTLFGEKGGDSLFGGGGNDYLDPGRTDRMTLRTTSASQGVNFSSQADRNTLNGGDGNDTLLASRGDDDFIGGAGADTADYARHHEFKSSFSPDKLKLSNDGIANDGLGTYTYNDGFWQETGSEFDNIRTDVENIVGGWSSDTIVGNAGANRLDGYYGNDSIVGGAGNDTLIGNNGNDSMYGQDGNDTLDGQADNDLFSGGGGFDSADYRLAPAGVKVSVDGIANDTLTVNGWLETDNVLDAEQILGSRHHDTLSGGAGVNQIFGGPGNDVLNGMGNNDSVYGGPGEDIIRGGDGNDTLDGQDQNDKVYGDAGNDSLLGGTGGDLLDGGAGNDRLDGQAGNDYLWGGANDDVLIGGAGADQLFGHDGNDTLFSRDNEPDKLDGGNGADKAQVDSKDMRTNLESLLA